MKSALVVFGGFVWVFGFGFCLVGVFCLLVGWGVFAIAALLAFIKNCAFCTGGVEGWKFKPSGSGSGPRILIHLLEKGFHLSRLSSC